MGLTTVRSALLVSALLTCALTPVQGQGGDTGGTSVSVPDTVGSFRVSDRRTFPNANEGMLFRYRRADGMTADVFLYPGPDLGTKCNIECARAELKREGDNFVVALPELVRRQYVDSIGAVTDSAMQPPAGASWQLGRHVTFETRLKGAPKLSELYLFYRPGVRIKVRITHDNHPGDREVIAAFAQQVALGITIGAPPGDASETTERTRERIIRTSTPAFACVN